MKTNKISERIIVFFTLTCFLIPQVGISQALSNRNDIVAENEFSLSEQSISSIDSQIFHNTAAIAFVENIEGQKEILKIQVVNEGFRILSQSNQQLFNVPIESISLSKNYAILLAKNLKQGYSGFYILSKTDLATYAFKTALPLYFIPLNPQMGDVKKIVIRHTEAVQESEMLIVTDNPEQSITAIAFNEIEDIIKFQMIYLAIAQAKKNPSLAKIGKLIADFRRKYNQFYVEMHQAFNQLGDINENPFVGKDLKSINWESASAEELALALSQTEEDEQVQSFKAFYAKKLAGLIDAFHTDYESLMKEVKFDLNRSPMASNGSSEVIDLLSMNTDPSQPKTNLDSDTTKAVGIYLGLTAATLLVCLGLPKLFKMTPWQAGASATQKWYGWLNGAWIKNSMNKLFPGYLASSEGVIARSLNSFSKMSVNLERQFLGINITGEQFKRSFWQVLADTATVVAAEAMTRPLYRKSSDADAHKAIFVDQAFTESHTLWWQKNVLFHVLSNQIIGTIGSAAQLAVIEKQLNATLEKFVMGGKLETLLATDKQVRQIAERISSDINTLEGEMSVKLRALSAKPQPVLSKVLSNQKITEVSKGWIEKIESLIAKKNLAPAQKAQLEQELSLKLKSVVQVKLNEQFENLSQRNGIFKKCFMAIGKGVMFALEKLNHRMAKGVSNLFGEVWESWIYGLKPGLVHSIALQTAFRGSWNGSMWIFGRGISLAFLSPFYIATYKAAKRTIGIQTAKGEFLYGLGYGVVTSAVYNWLFVKIYSDRIKYTAYDLEFTKYKEHFLGDGRPLDESYKREASTDASVH